jgi:hypothetical protein
MSPLWMLRHLLAIGVLPFTMAVLVPVWLARRYGIFPALGPTVGEVAVQVAGLALLVLGCILFVASLR